MFDKNIALIGAKYDAFDATAKTAGDPKVIKLEQYWKRAYSIIHIRLLSKNELKNSLYSLK